MVIEFTISTNAFLMQKPVQGWYSLPYKGYGALNNPDFLNVLKNTFGDNPADPAAKSESELQKAQHDLSKILLKDLPVVKKTIGTQVLYVLCVPRAKANMHESQLRFRLTLFRSVSEIEGLIGQPSALQRHTNTRTTHIKKQISRENDGPNPFVGITKMTCNLNASIRGRDVLLVDDIYTANVNIDEDAIQALFEAGARNVYFYAVAKTGG